MVSQRIANPSYLNKVVSVRFWVTPPDYSGRSLRRTAFLFDRNKNICYNKLIKKSMKGV